MNKKTSFICILVFFCLQGCVSLKEVNEFSASSVASLNKMNEIDYNFKTYCRQDCDLQQMRSGVLDTAFACDCIVPATKADAAIQKIHFTIISYLKAIEKLSDNKSFTYDVTNLFASLQENPLLHLSNQEVANFTKGGNFIANAATTFYRKKKLRQYLDEADPVFQNLTETFIYLIDKRLREQLKIGYETRVANILQMMKNAKNDKGFKQLVIKLYLEEQDFYRKNIAIINRYVETLQLVKRSHHDLYLRRDNLQSNITKELMKRYLADLQDIASGVKQ